MTTIRIRAIGGILTTLLLAGAACQLAEDLDFGETRMAVRYLDSEEAEFLRIINEYRVANGLGTLTSSATINQAAYLHSLDMGEQAYFEHASLDGRSPWDRMCAAAYRPACEGSTTMGENIAAGNEGAFDTFEQWRNSPLHNENMLTPDFVAVGIGRALVDGSPYRWYWTTDFGGILDVDGCACGPDDEEPCVTDACGTGVRGCDDRCQWQPCRVPSAGVEICDGYDNDCDGATDEDVCGSCVPTAEMCDGADNDCDTVIDENRVCGPACAPVGEETCNGNDDDCDGTIDEGCECPAGSPARPCGIAAGRCTVGEQSCVDGRWSECPGAVLPRREICDGLDNDCDGEIDEGACGADDGGDDGCGCAAAGGPAGLAAFGLPALLILALCRPAGRRSRREVRR
jgi:uncharacterized protein YkwD